MNEKSKKMIGNILFGLLIILILGGALLFAMNENPNKSIFGYRYYEVYSGSMSPEITTDDLLIVKITDPKDLEVGDIVTYAADETGDVVITHRLIEKGLDATGQEIYMTKGDASPTADEPIYGEAIIGEVVFKIPILGAVLSFIKANFILVGITLIGIVIIIVVVKKLREK